MLQHTLKEKFTLTGKGLHTGLAIEAVFMPAPENSGIVFKRTDLQGAPVVEALAYNVAATERGTVVKKGEAVVSTIEHTMAALLANNIDNCTIEVNAPEMPILDGSSIMICKAIENAGIVEQKAEREYFEIKETKKFTYPNGSEIIIEPSDKFSISSTICFDSPIIKEQTATLDNINDFNKEIAAARTFVFVREIQPLLQHNLIKGGDLDNAIVIYDEIMPEEMIQNLASVLGIKNIKVDKLGYLNTRPLAFDNEPARHKLLDIIGDFALLGKPMKGKVTAVRPGHSVNTQTARKLLENTL